MEHGEQQRPAGERAVPISGVLREEWQSLLGAGAAGGGKCLGKEGEASSTPTGGAGLGRARPMQAGSWGRGWRASARKAVLGAVPVWPAAGWGLE